MAHDEDAGVPDLSNRELLRVLIQEIVDVRRELKEDIASLDQKFTKKFDVLSSETKVLRLEVHQNHSSFIHRQDDLERRVEVLEVQAA